MHHQTLHARHQKAIRDHICSAHACKTAEQWMLSARSNRSPSCAHSQRCSRSQKASPCLPQDQYESLCLCASALSEGALSWPALSCRRVNTVTVCVIRTLPGTRAFEQRSAYAIVVAACWHSVAVTQVVVRAGPPAGGIRARRALNICFVSQPRAAISPQTACGVRHRERAFTTRRAAECRDGCRQPSRRLAALRTSTVPRSRQTAHSAPLSASLEGLRTHLLGQVLPSPHRSASDSAKVGPQRCQQQCCAAHALVPTSCGGLLGACAL